MSIILPSQICLEFFPANAESLKIPCQLKIPYLTNGYHLYIYYALYRFRKFNVTSWLLLFEWSRGGVTKICPVNSDSISVGYLPHHRQSKVDFY